MSELGWIEDGTLQEVPSFVVHVHFLLARHCNVNLYEPASNKTFPLASLSVCDPSVSIHFDREGSVADCDGFDVGRKRAEELRKRLRAKKGDHNHHEKVNPRLP